MTEGEELVKVYWDPSVPLHHWNIYIDATRREAISDPVGMKKSLGLDLFRQVGRE